MVALLTSTDVKKEENLPKDKCSDDKHVSKKKPDDDKDGKGAGNSDTQKQIVLQIRDKEKSTNAEGSRRNKGGNSETVKKSKQISKELTAVNPVMTEIEHQGENLISYSDKLIEAGDPESQKFCQTLKSRKEGNNLVL